MDEIDSLIEQVGAQLGEIANGDLVVGSAIKLGNVTIVPISDVAIGFGGGGGEGEDTGSKKKQVTTGGGRGLGGGGGVTPVAVAVFREGSVEVMKIPEKPNPVARLIEKIPDLIDRLKN